MIDITIDMQPDDESCGPTSLHAIYQYYGREIPLDDLVKVIERSHSGGTIAALLGNHALMHDFDATIYANNVTIFDPTWFFNGQSDPEYLKKKLLTQLRYKKNRHITLITNGYLRFLELGGKIRFGRLNAQLLKGYFEKKIPILTGLSATYLYQCARERYINNVAMYDDIRGKPCGHFVVLCGYDEKHRKVVVADPHRENPISHTRYYKVNLHRLINAILLGVLTYDATLLIIQPKTMIKDDTCKRLS